jgi:WD40 repeat protein
MNSEKKKLIKENDYQIGSGANFTCAKIGPVKCNVLAAGDDQSNITVWKLTEVKPRKIFTPENKSTIHSLIFNESVSKLYSGNMQGSAHTWDIEQGSLVRNF